MPHGRRGLVWRNDNGYAGYCNICDREFSNDRALVLHTMVKHPEIKRPKYIPTIDLCGICGKELQHGKRCKNGCR